jgi:Protein of unknown function (DUF3891)
MMVNDINEDEVMLVMQLDHSRVAGQLAAAWGNEQFAPVAPYESMVLAAQEHDTGWWEWEAKPTLNAKGRPLDYIGSASFLGATWLDFYRRVVDRIATDDPYAGYMVSMHGNGLLNKAMGLLPNLPDLSARPLIHAFIEEQQQYRRELLPQLQASSEFGEHATDERIWRNYNLMEVFDQFAQFVCNRYPLNSERRTNGPTPTLSDLAIPVAEGLPDTRLHIEVISETAAVVTPYPFATDEVSVVFPAKILPKKEYADRSAFLRDFYTARPVVASYQLRRAAPAA